MKKTALLSLLIISAGPIAAQQVNGNFNGDWETCYPNGGTSSSGIQPSGWGASNVHQVLPFSDLVTQGADRTSTDATAHSVKLLNTFCGFSSTGSTAPAYVTLGDTWNYGDYANLNTPQDRSDGGSYGGMDFIYRPDSISLWVKRTHLQGEPGSGTANPNENATVLVYAWKGSTSSTVRIGLEMSFLGNARDITMENRDKDVLGMITSGVTKSEDFELISKTENYIEGDITEWTRVVFPITYLTNSTPEKLNIVLASSDYFNRSNLGVGNEFDIDDVELIYNSQLASLAYNGTAIENFDKDEQYYTVTGEYAEGCLTAVSDGAGATTSISYDATTRIATITVQGNDVSVNPENQHEYYVMFAPKTTAYASKLIMGLAGTMLPPATENVGISEINGGKAHFLLSNFAFQGTVMGDILLTDVDCQEEADGSITLHKEQTIRVFGDAGNTLGDLPVVLNGTLKDGKLNADLSIMWNGVIPISVNVYPTSTPYVDLTALTGVTSQFAAVKDGLTNPNCLFYVTDATLAGDNVIVDTECQKLVLSEDAAFFAPKAFTAAEVSFDRDFAAGRVNTFVLPFTFTVPDGISVTKLNKVEGTTLTFSPVTTAEANTPYLIETNETRPFDALTNVEVAATATVDVTVSGVTHHGAFDSETVTSGETTYYGWNENGEFVKATTGTLLPFRTYLTTSAAQAAPAFKVIMDKPTGIDTITTTETDGAIYDLTGRRVEKAVKGIYIRDGKKVYIK